jgi:predicted nucleic acid-binding protein
MELEKLKSKAYDLLIVRGRINQELSELDNRIKEAYNNSKVGVNKETKNGLVKKLKKLVKK